MTFRWKIGVYLGQVLTENRSIFRQRDMEGSMGPTEKIQIAILIG